MLFRRIHIFLILLTSSYLNIFAVEAEPAWIFFKDKNTSEIDPSNYFSPGSLSRRISLGLPPFDHHDLPVNGSYESTVKEHSIEFYGSSRWLNASLILADKEQLFYLSRLNFIAGILTGTPPPFKTADYKGQIDKNSVEPDDDELSELREKQLEFHEAEIFKNSGFDGSGIRIAVFDGGFSGADKHPAFEHLFNNTRIVSTWDFANKSQDVYKFNEHGTSVLSCIAGIKDGLQTGMAPGAEFILARTELPGEPWREELYWIQAAEWADKLGAKIISSSLGYGFHRYFQEDLDGNSTPVARAANIASRKGILVINCMGNEGDTHWKYAVSPADSDSVLSVGGIDPESELHISFSSYGPNKVGELKPNVVAAGKVLVATTKSWKANYGTSFSAPLITGFAACTWQMYPHLSNMDIFRLVEKSGHLFPYFDYAHGYGIPKASLLERQDLVGKKENPDISINILNGKIMIRSLPEIDKNKYLYYSVNDVQNRILKYGVFVLDAEKPAVIDIKRADKASSIHLRTSGYYTSLQIKSLDEK